MILGSGREKISYSFSTSPPVSPSPIKERGREFFRRGATPLLNAPFIPILLLSDNVNRAGKGRDFFTFIHQYDIKSIFPRYHARLDINYENSL